MNKQIQRIFVCGPVGVGKSTFIDNLVNKFTNRNVKTVPEYITGDPNGNQMFLNFINKKITAKHFQTYILDYYDKKIKEVFDTCNEADVVIFERLPGEAVAMFARRLWRKRQMTHEDYNELKEQLSEIEVKYNLPSIYNETWNMDDYEFVTLKTLDDIDLTEPIALLANTIPNHDVVVGLTNCPPTCWKRIKKRNRNGEDAYDYKTISEFCNRYDKIFSKLTSMCDENDYSSDYGDYD